jgi:hypothetical protein
MFALSPTFAAGGVCARAAPGSVNRRTRASLEVDLIVHLSLAQRFAARTEIRIAPRTRLFIRCFVVPLVG